MHHVCGKMLLFLNLYKLVLWLQHALVVLLKIIFYLSVILLWLLINFLMIIVLLLMVTLLSQWTIVFSCNGIIWQMNKYTYPIHLVLLLDLTKFYYLPNLQHILHDYDIFFGFTSMLVDTNYLVKLVLVLCVDVSFLKHFDKSSPFFTVTFIIRSLNS